MSAQTNTASFAGLVDLASDRVGGKALAASDEFFAGKENLLKPGRGIFLPDKYTDRGKWMDGWESRRKREPGFDWCIIQLGIPGVIKGVDIDTNFFLGNHPPYGSIEACRIDPNIPAETLTGEEIHWTEILSKSPLNAGSQNLFAVMNSESWTHIRLNIYPDGGVARLRIYGAPIPDWSKFKQGALADLAAVENGGLAVACSDMFFSSMNNLIMPGRADNMGDGWETKRRRGAGSDWVIVKLGREGSIKKIEVDTNHFKGNFPDRCSMDGCHEPDKNIDILTWTEVTWKEILAETKLQADTRHFFEKELKGIGPCTHVRLNIFPDGGVSRLRVWGTITSH